MPSVDTSLLCFLLCYAAVVKSSPIIIIIVIVMLNFLCLSLHIYGTNFALSA